MGLLDSFMGILPEEGSAASNNLLDVGQALGMSLLQGNRQQPFANVAQNMAVVQQGSRSGMSKAALKQLLIQKGYTEAEADKYATSETATKLALQAKEDEGFQSMVKGGFGIGGTPAMPAISPAAPAGPAAGVSLNGSQSDKAKAVYDGLIQRGLSPVLAAGMTGNIDAESSFNPGAVGDKGTAYGYHQARADRYDNLNAIAKARGVAWNDHDAQLDNIAAEFGGKDAGMAKAKALIDADPNMTPQKAAEIIARYGERPAASALAESLPRRAGTAAQVYSQFGQAAAPTRVADASGAVPGINPAIGMPNGRPQVAETEQQTQALEGRMNMYPPSVYNITAPAAVAQADLPATGAAEAGFEIPPGQGAQPAPKYGPDTATGRAIAARQSRNTADEDRQIQEGLAKIAMSGRYGEKGKAYAEAIKLQLQPLLENRKRTDVEKLADAAGLEGQARLDALSGAIPGNAPTTERKDYEYAQRTPGYEDYQKRMKEATRSQVNIDQRAAGKFEEGLGSKAAERFNSYIEAGDAAKRRLGDVGVLRDASRTLGSLGKSADFRAAIGPYAEALGVPIQGLADIQVFQSTAARLAPQLREPGAGATSDRDLAGFEKAIGQLSATPEAREKILDVFEAGSRNQVKAAQIARDVSSGRLTRQEGEDQLQNLPDPLAAFREYQKANPDSRSAPKPETAVPMTATDRAVSIQRAKDFIRTNPGQRDAVIKRLRENNIPTDAL